MFIYYIDTIVIYYYDDIIINIYYDDIPRLYINILD